MSDYTYNYSQTATGLVEPYVLQLECEVLPVVSISTDSASETVTITTSVPLDAGQITTLDGIVAAHTGEQPTNISGSSPFGGGGAVRVVTTNDITPLSGLPLMSGVQLVEGDKVLLVGQAGGDVMIPDVENGPWVVHGGPWTRPSDFDTETDLRNGAIYLVREGGNGMAGVAVQLSTTGEIIVGTTPVSFALFPASYSAADVGTDPVETGLVAEDVEASLAELKGLIGALPPLVPVTFVPHLIYNSNSPYAPVASDCFLILDTTSGPITVDLPPAAGNGGRYFIFILPYAVMGGATIQPDDTLPDQINGQANRTLTTAFELLRVVAIGGNQWMVI